MQLVDIGGRRLAMWSSGTGEPAVLLETGLGAPAADWEAVHRGVASFTTVVHYDRANCGASDPVDKPRTARDMAEDLHALVAASGSATPLVLVGHSFGGPICLTYANNWPDEVAGVVLVDPTHPDQFTSIGPLMPDALGPLKVFSQEGWRSTASTEEGVDFLSTFEDMRSIETIGEIPMVVLTASTWEGLNGSHEAQDIWVGLHREYAGLADGGQQRVLPQKDHFLQRCAPEAIVEAIEDVVRTVRA